MLEVGAASRRSQRAAKPSKGDMQERALVDAAARIIASGETATASVADIADMAGISRASFYFYFASKQALFATVVDETVSLFNRRILEVAAVEHDDPAEAVRVTVEAAGQLWWDHAAVMTASVMLGSSMPDVYARSMQNILDVSTPTVELLRRYGTVPEAQDPIAAAELVTSLILLCERGFYDLMRTDPSRDRPTPADRDRLVDRLTTIWLRAFGISEPT